VTNNRRAWWIGNPLEKDSRVLLFAVGSSTTLGSPVSFPISMEGYFCRNEAVAV
jgi:hypothetical protein